MNKPTNLRTLNFDGCRVVSLALLVCMGGSAARAQEPGLMEESFKAIAPRGPDLFSFTRTVRARCRRDRTGVGCESNIPAVAGILLTEKLSDVPFTYEAPGQQTDIESELRGPAIEDLFLLGQQIEKKCSESKRLENMCNRLIATVMRLRPFPCAKITRPCGWDWDIRNSIELYFA